VPGTSRRGRDSAQGESGLAASSGNPVDDCASFAARNEDEDARHDQEEVEEAEDAHDYTYNSGGIEVSLCAVRHLLSHGGGAEGQAAHEKSSYGWQEHEHAAVEKHQISDSR
jgi:hypothetical protein